VLPDRFEEDLAILPKLGLPTKKLKRGSFPTTFSLACFAPLGLDGVALEDV
jgi:hypothetical protein